MGGADRNERDLRPFLAMVAEGVSLSESDAARAFDVMMSGDASPAQIGAFLMALHLRGETVEEITGATKTMREKSLKVTAPAGAMDIVGTGGDAHGTYNVSTAAALVVAGCGVPVAKHGNRAFSSKSGAADVLSELGIDMEAPPKRVQQSIAEAGIGFLFAPIYHSAMRHVGPARAEMGVRTTFNILGPLSNPAAVKRLLVGAFSAHWLEPMARVLGNLGAERVWVVHGSDGMDELTTTGPSHVAELAGDVIRTFEATPEDAGLPRASLGDLKGGTPAENAAAIQDLLKGAAGAFRDIVLLNAAAALMVAGRVDTLRNGAEAAARAIDEGAAAAALDRMLTLTGTGKAV